MCNVYWLALERSGEGPKVGLPLSLIGLPFPSKQVTCEVPRDIGIAEMNLKWSESCSVVLDSSQSHGLYSPWNSLGQNTRVGSCSLLQGIVPTHRSNPGLPHCRQIFYQLSHKGNPKNYIKSTNIQMLTVLAGSVTGIILEEEMATHSSVLAWRIPGTVRPGGLPSMGSHRVGHNWNDLAVAAFCPQRLVFKWGQCLWIEDWVTN